MTELSEIALKHQTDKWGHHWYTDHYYNHLLKFKHSNINLLEIGVGGYEFPDRGGGSLRMWKEFFYKAQIFAIDLYDKSQLQEDRIKIFQGSQDDPAFLHQVHKEIGNIHVVIDDGSHLCKHQIESFLHVFPLLDFNGIYIIEDTETSYWPDYGGHPDAFKSIPSTRTIDFFLQLVHGQNYMTIPDYPVTELNKTIKSISFYRNLIIIEKGENK